MWGVDAYASHSPGEMYAPVFIDMARPEPVDSVLDAGCGAGCGALALQASGIAAIELCDLTDAGLLPAARAFRFAQVCLWEDLRPSVGEHDWVYCCDVMEHIPPAFTMLVVSRLLEVARKGVFLSISLTPDVMGAWIGKPLHLTVQSFTDWRDQLNAVGHVVEARDLLNAGVFLVKPR